MIKSRLLRHKNKSVKMLRNVPGLFRFPLYKYSVASFAWFAIMDNVCYEVIL
jgi:hypothetical protein